MRFVLLLTILGPLAAAAPADEKTKPEVVKALRAALAAKRQNERDELLKQFLERKDLDWPSVRNALQEGRYYQKPLVTAYKIRHSSKHWDLVLSGHDGKPRGFSLYLPTSYVAKDPVPVLLYLHHAPGQPHLQGGRDRAGVAVVRFRKMAEKHGILFVAPYTSKGAEWWTPEGKRLVAWTLRQLRRLYKIDDDRIALMGAMGGADAVWYLGQEMPGAWSVLMPMTGDAYEIGALIRPLFLGTLDRMDILMGVPGVTKSTVGTKDTNKFLQGLNPMFHQRMRITAAIYPRAQGDFRYLDSITEQVASFVLSKKRKPFAVEVDVETEAGHPLQSLWLRNDGHDPDGDVPPRQINDFKSTLLKWTPPAGKGADKKVGLSLHARPGWEVGMLVTGTPGEAKNAKIYPRDVLLEADGVPLRKLEDLKPVIRKHDWNDEVRLLLAREVPEDHLERAQKAEERYKRVRKRIEELRAAGKPIPDDIEAEIEDEEDDAEEEEEDDDEGGIIISGDDDEKKEDEKAKPGRKAKRSDTHVLIIERWVKLRRPAGPLFRADFGASWDQKFKKEGVKIASVFAGSLAKRSGLKKGDVIVQIGDTAVKKVHDIPAYLKEIDFKFEKEPAGKRGVDLTVKRKGAGHADQWSEHTVHVAWEPVLASRVDAKWNKKENTLTVWSRKASGFTLFFADELIAPGKEFHLFINNVPYQDLVDPKTTPDYPHVRMGAGAELADELYRMRRRRAKVKGWEPDIKWAIEKYLKTWDRRLVLGGQRSFDLTKMKEGVEKARTRHTGRRGKLGARVKAAYDKHREERAKQ
jgi:S1-C subfamily serine protease